MSLSCIKALFVKDVDGIMIMTDIEDKPDVTYGEIVYDGKNVAVLNRDNKDFYLLPNIQPNLREELLHADEVTIIEQREHKDIYAYSLKVRAVEDMKIEDNWDKYAQAVVEELYKNLSKEDFDSVVEEAEKLL